MVARRMKRYLPFTIIIAVACVAVAGGAVLYRAKKAELTATVPDATSAGKPGAKSVHIRGAAKAPVTIEEFGDFQCPPCETLAGWLPKLEREYAGKVRILFRNFPLQMHNHALAAARVAEAAGLQGKFWEMHDTLYRNRAAWVAAGDVAPLFEDYAGQIRLDVAKFKADVASEPVKARVAADQERGTSLGVTSTPTLFLNNRLVPPKSINEKMLRAAIDDTLNNRNPFPTATPSPTPSSTPATSQP